MKKNKRLTEIEDLADYKTEFEEDIQIIKIVLNRLKNLLYFFLLSVP